MVLLTVPLAGLVIQPKEEGHETRGTTTRMAGTLLSLPILGDDVGVRKIHANLTL